jgi:hypothetical protein
MKPEGKLVIGIRSKESMLNLPMVQYGFKLYDEHELEALLQQTGLQSVKVFKEDEPVISVAGNTVYFQSLFGIGQK